MAQRSHQAGGSGPFDRTGFLPVAKRWWWLFLASTVIAGFVGYFVTQSASPRYESRVELLVGPISADSDTIKAAGQLAQTYAELATSRPLLESTIAELKLPMATGELKAATVATANDITRFLTIRVENESAAQAANIANKLADNLIELVARGNPQPAGTLQVSDSAGPGQRVGANSSFIVALAAAAGLLGALTLVLLAEYLSGTVKSEEELADVTDIAFLGSVDGPRRRLRTARPLVVEAQPDLRLAASYRVLAAEIELTSPDGAIRSLLVVGAQIGNAAGEVAANLAWAFASTGRKVALVDTDAGEGEVTRLLGLDAHTGLSDLPENPAVLERLERLPYVNPAHLPALDVLPRGLNGAADTLEPARAQQLLARLLADHELVIFAGAPAQDSPTTLTWAHTADCTILAVARDRTKRARVGDAVESLRLVGANVVGAVFTQGRALKRRPRPAAAARRRKQRPRWTAPGEAVAPGDRGLGSPADVNGAGEQAAEPLEKRSSRRRGG